MNMHFNLALDNSELIKNAMFEEIDKAMKTIGIKAEGYAKKNLTDKGAVDTGRLRNSVTHTNDKNTVYIGTNVEYAPYIEMGTSKMDARPYLGPAITEHADEYKEIIENELKR